jgi:hypothetical protein
MSIIIIVRGIKKVLTKKLSKIKKKFLTNLKKSIIMKEPKGKER